MSIYILLACDLDNQNLYINPKGSIFLFTIFNYSEVLLVFGTSMSLTLSLTLLSLTLCYMCLHLLPGGLGLVLCVVHLSLSSRYLPNLPIRSQHVVIPNRCDPPKKNLTRYFWFLALDCKVRTV